MTVRNLEWPEERNTLLAHFQQVYRPPQSDLLAASYGQTPGFDPADCFVIDGHGGEIAAHAMLMPRPLQIGASVLSVAELGALSVLPAYREQGYAVQLAGALHTRMIAREDALGLTFAVPDAFAAWQYEAAVGLYLTYFESVISVELANYAGQWNMQHGYERRTASRLDVRGQAVSVRRFYSSDLPAVGALYQAASAQGHYLFARGENDWLWQVQHLAQAGYCEPDDFLVAEVDGQLVAYVRVVARTGVNLFRVPDPVPFSVIEVGGTHPDGIEALLAEVARTAQTFGAQQIGLFVHPDSAFMRHALARGACLRQFTGAAFMRLNNLAVALHELQSVLALRCAASRFAGRAIRLSVTTEHEQAVVVWGQGTPELVELEVPASEFVRLITGWHGIDHLPTGYQLRHADLLRVLFPPSDPKIGLADVL